MNLSQRAILTSDQSTPTVVPMVVFIWWTCTGELFSRETGLSLALSLEKKLIASDYIKIAGASSDMIVLDLGDSPQHYKVGSLISFRVKYMGALRLLNSDYIDKIVE